MSSAEYAIMEAQMENERLKQINEDTALAMRLYESVDSNQSDNNGGSTSYYELPNGASELQDLIEHNNMSWNQANVFKAMYRYGRCGHSDQIRDVNKCIWFLKRELILLTKNSDG
jgi:hypothetical protein